jgi:hypothetical protein
MHKKICYYNMKCKNFHQGYRHILTTHIMSEAPKIKVPDFPSRSNPEYLKKAAEATKTMRDLTAAYAAKRLEIANTLASKAA